MENNIKILTTKKVNMDVYIYFLNGIIYSVHKISNIKIQNDKTIIHDCDNIYKIDVVIKSKLTKTINEFFTTDKNITIKVKNQCILLNNCIPFITINKWSFLCY
jgi:hypothetical protein